MLLGKLIALWMQTHGISIRALASEIGIDPATLHRLVRGQETGNVVTFGRILVWMLSKPK